jgi:hypothetical protein
MGFTKPDQAALNKYRDEAQSTYLSLPLHQSPAILPCSLADDQRNTTNTGPRTAIKFEMELTFPVSRPDGMMPLRYLLPIIRFPMIWMVGPNRGLLRRNSLRGLGSGNMDTRRVSGLLSKLEALK